MKVTLPLRVGEWMSDGARQKRFFRAYLFAMLAGWLILLFPGGYWRASETGKGDFIAYYAAGGC